MYALRPYPASVAIRGAAQRRTIAAVLAVALVLAFVPLLPATHADAIVPVTWYVSAQNGSDVTGDGSPANPFATITSALATAAPGDTILVGPGEYADEDWPLMPDDYQSIVATAGSSETTLAGPRNWFDPVVELDAVSGVLLEGFSVTGGYSADGGGIVVYDADDVRVKDCYFTQNVAEGGGAAGVWGSGVEFDGCTFHQNGWLPSEPETPTSREPLREGAVEATMPPFPDTEGWDVINYFGGAVDAVYSEVRFQDCTFTENSAVYGGAVDAEGSFVGIGGSEFSGNVAVGGLVEGMTDPFAPGSSDRDPLLAAQSEMPAGGALFVYHSYALVATSTLTGNFAEGMGGAVWADYEAYTELDGVHLAENLAFLGGAVAHAPIEEMWWFWSEDPGANQAPDGYDRYSIEETPPPEPLWRPYGWDLTVYDSEFIGNGGVFAPGIFSLAAPYYVENGLFAQNYALDAGPVVYDEPYWEVFYAGADAGQADEGPPLIAGEGGLWATWLNHCTFANNVAESSVEFYDEGVITNSIFWDNDYATEDMATSIAGFTEPESLSGLVESLRPRVVPPGEDFVDVLGGIVLYSDLEYGHYAVDPFMTESPSDASPTDATLPGSFVLEDIVDGNISEDPQWADPVSGDYRLTFGSPASDTATDLADFFFLDGPYIAPWDLDKTDRPQDGDLDGMAVPDMGCYELVPREEGTAGRLWGQNRYATAADASREYFPTADTVFIARGDVFADALSCAGLAGFFHAPVLLTRPDSLPGETSSEIKRLGATKAFVLGGPLAVAPGVIDEIEALGLEVERIGGSDRYETSALLAARLAAETGDATPTATFIARGDTWPDALAVSPVAFATQSPILLVRPDELPRWTVDVLAASTPSDVVIVGGKRAVDARVAKSLIFQGIGTERVAGSNRYETAVAVADYATDQGWSRWDVTGLATGAHFADALTGGPCIGRVDGVVLLTDPDSLSPATSSALSARAAQIVRLDVLGGPGAITGPVMTEAQDLVD